MALNAIQKHLLDPPSVTVLNGGFKDGDYITATLTGRQAGFG